MRSSRSSKCAEFSGDHRYTSGYPLFQWGSFSDNLLRRLDPNPIPVDRRLMRDHCQRSGRGCCLRPQNQGDLFESTGRWQGHSTSPDCIVAQCRYLAPAQSICIYFYCNPSALVLNQARVSSDIHMSIITTSTHHSVYTEYRTRLILHLKPALGIRPDFLKSAVTRDLRRRSHKDRLFKA
jgi:hypothetical protein